MDVVNFTHPEDAAALDALKKIPVLPAVVKSFMDLGVEQLQTGLSMATKVRLSPTLLQYLYYILSPICEWLGIKDPEFYIEMSPEPNAYALGDTQRHYYYVSAGGNEKLEQNFSPKQIDHVRELLAEISVLAAVRNVFEKE